MMNMIKMKDTMMNRKILLGPVLGLEQDYLYSVIFVSSNLYQHSDLRIQFSSHGEKIIEPCISVMHLHSTFAYKFVFRAQAHQETYTTNYSITLRDSKLSNEMNESNWSFVVPGTSVVPKIGFSSCNGNSKLLPQDQDDRDYVMWERLYKSHKTENLTHSFHCLIMGGDQIYADPIWKSIPYFKKHKLLGWRSNKAIANHEISKENRPALEAELEAFYESLYIESWSKPAVAKTLAAIPSIMMWDDHDIFDGWGSQPPELQASEIFQLIYKVAKKYFEVFQIRGKDNASRISNTHYSLQLRFRNFEIFALDNRSYRTNKQVMSDEQFEDLEEYLQKDLFEDVPEALSAQKVLLFSIPVPIAHLNYKERTERMLRWQLPFNFRYSFNDDALDHWDHGNHTGQQKRLLDYIFSLADHASPKYVHIISGDVHSAGAGRIIKESENEVRVVNEFISSPIVYKPVGKIEQLLLSRLSDEYSEVEGYKIGIYRFGFDPKRPKTIYQRNFGCFYKGEGQGLRVYYTYQNMVEDDIPGQPSVYLRPIKGKDENILDQSYVYSA